MAALSIKVFETGGSKLFTFTNLDPSDFLWSGHIRLFKDSKVISGEITFDATETTLTLHIPPLPWGRYVFDVLKNDEVFFSPGELIVERVVTRDDSTE